MPRLEFFLVSGGVSIDQRTNQLSIFNVLDEFHTLGFPAVVAELIILACFISDDIKSESEDYQMKVKVTAPDGEYKEFPVNFKMTTKRHRVYQNVAGIPINKEGELKFEAILNGKHMASHTVDVILDK